MNDKGKQLSYNHLSWPTCSLMPLNSYRQGEENLKNANFMANEQEQAKNCVSKSINQGSHRAREENVRGHMKSGEYWQVPRALIFRKLRCVLYIFKSKDRNNLKKFHFFDIF